MHIHGHTPPSPALWCSVLIASCLLPSQWYSLHLCSQATKDKTKQNCEHTKPQTDKFYYHHQGGFSLIQFVCLKDYSKQLKKVLHKNVFTEVQAWPNLVPINFEFIWIQDFFFLKDSSGLQQRAKLVISSHIHITVLSSHIHITSK